MRKRRYVTSEALARVARRAGIRREQERVREAWDKGLFAIRSPGSGSGTSAYPKPDYIIFNKGGTVDVVQCKTTRKYHNYFNPSDWESEVEAAKRLREIGFKARVWLDFTLFRIGRSNTINEWFRIDSHEKDCLNIKFISKTQETVHKWKPQNSKSDESVVD